MDKKTKLSSTNTNENTTKKQLYMVKQEKKRNKPRISKTMPSIGFETETSRLGVSRPALSATNA